ncbi:type I polyketide synthase [Paenibacillus qinlingensis]|uniref:type I polyketide synthase n=1 Tax=Paenibacillus qinlingensis TaxID=1837343 RepID=UPI0015676B81|nr:type I polyketide synthase [Paenibacillus qinlingensis]NQX57963.1 acyltransferase domain-containing protein [Paenibacillus qinlingensis]
MLSNIVFKYIESSKKYDIKDGKHLREQFDIAVVGVSALFPGAADNTSFWRNILEGRDSITDVPRSHWLIDDYYDPDPTAPDKTYCKRGGFISDVTFNPVEFAMPPHNLKATDTSQLLALIVAKKVLEDACQSQFSRINRDRTSVILGVASATELVVHLGSRIQRPYWAKALRDSGFGEEEVNQICDRIANLYVPWQESSFPGLLGNVVAGRIASHFDLKGTNTVLDAACASSLSALSLAVMELQAGKSDLVITGGVDTLNDIFMFMSFSKTPALSPTGDCRPFSDQADGTILGEGLGMVALKRLKDAEADGDAIYAVIKGIGTSSDGKSKSIYAPRSEGQAIALSRAYEEAGYEPETVELVEAHGTGTKAGDAAEFAGLRSVFETEHKKTWCALGSVKSQIGHTKAAAGSAALFKAVAALQHRVLPATIKVERPNPNLDIENSPFYLNTEARPWIRSSDHPRRASVSSFGFGGSNFHVTLEEYTNPGRQAPKFRTLPAELFVYTARDGALLGERLNLLGTSLAEVPETSQEELFRFLAKDSQMNYDAAQEARAGIVAGDLVELREKLLKAGERLSHMPAEPYQDVAAGVYIGFGHKDTAASGRIAFLFPGQGSQYIGMGKDLAITFDSVREVWDEAAALGLHELVFPKPAFDERAVAQQVEALTDTRAAQPAIGLVSLSMAALMRQLGVKPDAVAGHSFGELTALAFSDVISPTDLLLAASKRGELMHKAAAIPGAMTAVFAEPGRVQAIMAEAGVKEANIANYNSPEQVVVSGVESELALLESALKARGVRFSRLQVGSAFHSALVAPSIEPFRTFLEEITFQAGGQIPVYANSTADRYPEDSQEMKNVLASQIAKPVRFAEQISRMAEQDVKLFIEVGPGKTLTGLVKQILKDRPDVQAVAMDHKNRNGIVSLWHMLAQLAVHGIPLTFSALWNGYKEPKDPRDEKVPAYTVKLNGANYGKPYPPKDEPVSVPSQPLPVQVAESSLKPSIDRQVNDMKSQQFDEQQPKQTALNNVNQTQHMAVPMASALPASYLVYFQRQMTEAHLSFQKALSDSHHAYLRSSEMMLAALTGQGWSERPEPASLAIPDLNPMFGAAPYIAADLAMPMYHLPVQTPVVPQTPAPFVMPPAPAVPVEAVRAIPAAPAQMTAPSPSPAPVQRMVEAPPLTTQPVAVASVPSSAVSVSVSSSTQDVEAIMLKVVADKTGYPVEMLDLDADLESGLGIDSIKRVEILSAVQEQLVDCPSFDPSDMASLHTLREIIGYLDGHGKKNGI